jgi:DmsE family decaheme c-type cytochrome
MPVVPVPDATYVGSEGCAVCHEDVFEYFRKTVHYKIRRFEVTGEERGCESCHGPGSAHVLERGNVDNILSFSKLTPAQSSAICLKCHSRGHLIDWSNNLHALSDVGCNECHKSHKTTAKNMLYKSDPDLCYDCHQQMQARAQFPSHHPIREGKMKCADCHNPHGSEFDIFSALNVNDLCYECHAEKQGPFIYEHQPVEEDCSLCHDPHGTIANNLLKQNEPFLCLRCHTGHRGVQLAGSHPSMSSFVTSCTQCHSQVHGSDLPSQSGMGALTR